METYLVTGGAGFIGSNFARYMLSRHDDCRIINLDALTYAGNVENLAGIEEAYPGRYEFVKGDITDAGHMTTLFGEKRPDVVVNFAAESHNDRALLDPAIFVKTNVLGTQTLLHCARESRVARFHHISTCEVYGDLALDSPKRFGEDAPYAPHTPYSASKAAADHVVMAYHHSFALPVTITNCSNNYGPYQFPEKIIPLFVTNALEGKQLPLFKSSANKREWLHVLDHCRAVDVVIRRGRDGEKYNVGSGVEKTIEEVADVILEVLAAPDSLRTYVDDRQGHDRRYLLDSAKIRTELGWEVRMSFSEGMRETIHWYRDHPEWWRRVKSGEYLDYYRKVYKTE